MKILFVAENSGVDYMPNCLLHGLYEIENVEVYLTSDLWYMFDGNDEKELLQLYGKGFSVTNRIPRNKKCVQDKETVLARLKEHFYDVVIYGSVFRCMDYFDQVLQSYDKKEVIFVDGEDFDLSMFYTHQLQLSGYHNMKYIKIPSPRPWRRIGRHRFAMDLAAKGIYFKRELLEKDAKYMNPISFAIPAKSIVETVPDKERDLAYIIPGDKSTYIYDSETAYYEGYRKARRGVTFKKAGWDCMRHYEILANGCIPYFPDIRQCPVHTMFNFPKSIIVETNRLFDCGGMSEQTFRYIAEYLLQYTRMYLTTKELAKYVLSKTDIDKTIFK